MSDPRQDDEEPLSIEADAPEADWIEQHQQVIGESDDELFPSEIPDDVSEADALDQARTVPDDDLDLDRELPTESPTPRFAQATDDDELDQRASTEGLEVRGCNLIAVIADTLMRLVRDASGQISKKDGQFQR